METATYQVEVIQNPVSGIATVTIMTNGSVLRSIETTIKLSDTFIAEVMVSAIKILSPSLGGEIAKLMA